MKRREFLRSMLTGVAGATLPGLWAVEASGAACPSGQRALVTVFLRGGCDGLNVVIPYGEDAYHRNRRGIAIAAPGRDGARSALDLNGFFGLHPALKPLYRLYQEGRVALLPAVHYSRASRSHFRSQAALEGALEAGKDADGWLNRYLRAGGHADGGSALALGSLLPHSLQGKAPVSAYSDPSGLRLSPAKPENSLLDYILRTAYDPNKLAAHPGAKMWAAQAKVLLRDLETLKSGSPDPEGYPKSPFGRTLSQAAALLRANERLRIVSVDLGGWDSHRGQGGAEGGQARLLAELASGIAAFERDLGRRRNDVTILVMTEFGRTLAQNGSGGTDHGHAATWMVIGSRVQGGLYLGQRGWPGLEDHQLVDGRSLAHSVDFRDVYAELLSGHLGCANLGFILPGHRATPLGMFG